MTSTFITRCAGALRTTLGAAVMAALAGTVYIVTLSRGAFPGESASLLLPFADILPRLSPNHPLWDWAMRLVAVLPGGTLAWRANVFSALCAAIAVGLLYRVVAGFIRLVSDEQGRAVDLASVLAGAVASLFLAFCAPFWIVATRAQPAALDVALLLGCAALLLRLTEQPGSRAVYALAFLVGVTAVEFATMLLFLPLFFFAAMYVLWHEEPRSARRMAGAVGCGIGGLLFYLPAAWSFVGTEGYRLREYTGFFKVLWMMWRDQYVLIARGLPQTGWLLVIVIGIVPCFAGLMAARRSLAQERDWGLYLLHLLLSGLTLAVLLNWRLAPWPLLGEDRMLVTPYVLTAALYGYLAAYWTLVIRPTGDEEFRGVTVAKGVLTALLSVSVVLGVAWASFRNAAIADGRRAAFADRYVDAVLDSLGGRTWILTDGSLDANLLLRAAQRDQPLRAVNLRSGGNLLYCKLVASWLDSPRMQNVALVGLMPLVEEWMRSDPAVTAHLAVLGAPDVWLGGGFKWLPEGLVFGGARTLEGVDVAGLARTNAAVRTALLPSVLAAPVSDDTLGQLRKEMLRHISLVANNTGVMLADAALREDAFAEFSAAREADPDNLSALMNQYEMVKTGYETPDADLVRARFDAVKSSTAPKPFVWALAREYGYVRSPSVFADLGLAWAFSGQPGMALSGLKTALELSSPEQKGAVKERLAAVYLAQQQDEASVSLYRELLAENPAHEGALLGLARLAIRRGDWDEAKSLLDRAAAAGVAKPVIALETAFLNVMAGRLAEARILLEEQLHIAPENLRALALLADVLLEQDDQDALARCMETLVRVNGGRVVSLEIRARQALRRRDLRTARSCYNDALALVPNNARLLEKAVQLNLLAGDVGGTRGAALRLLAISPRNAYANYAMGNLQIGEGEYDRAEDSIRKSLGSESLPEALNDLAWLLMRRGVFAEAEEHIRAALKINDRTYQYWDTLGEILLKTGRIDEAEAALRRALALYQEDPVVLLHMAETLAAKGNREQASAMLSAAEARRAQLTAEDVARLDDVRRRLRAP